MQVHDDCVHEIIRNYLIDGSRSFNIDLSPAQVDLFVQYYHLLVQGNKKVNLTHITAPKEVAIKHFIDSLSCLNYFDTLNVRNLIDVGTGAGFPGIPVKIVLPEINLTLLDSLQKRIQFLKNVVEGLALKEVTLVHERAEVFGRNYTNRDHYDMCISRAVAPLRILVELCLPVIKVDGKFLALKGPEIENEVFEAEKGLRLLGGKVEEIKKFSLPVFGDGRSIIVIRKIETTPSKYPRRAGIPAKRPL